MPRDVAAGEVVAASSPKEKFCIWRFHCFESVTANVVHYLRKDQTSQDIEHALAALAQLTAKDDQPTPSLDQMRAAVEAKLASVSERLIVVGVKPNPSGGAIAIWRHTDIRVGHITSSIYMRPKPSRRRVAAG